MAPLIPFVESASPESREEKALVSTLISAFMQNYIWTAAESYRHLPIEADSDRYIDMTSVLPRKIARQMTAVDALSILETTSPNNLLGLAWRDWGSDRPSAPRLGASSRKEILAALVERVLDEHSEDVPVLRKLIPLAMTVNHWSGHDLISREEGLKHGIFVVGWNGKLGTWYDSKTPRPKKDPAALQTALSRQAAIFKKDHPGLEVRAVVLNLAPREGM